MGGEEGGGRRRARGTTGLAEVPVHHGYQEVEAPNELLHKAHDRLQEGRDVAEEYACLSDEAEHHVVGLPQESHQAYHQGDHQHHCKPVWERLQLSLGDDKDA